MAEAPVPLGDMDVTEQYELTIQQQNQLRIEAERAPLVAAQPEPLNDTCSLVEEFSCNPDMLRKVRVLYAASAVPAKDGSRLRYSSIRRVRRDGNCFFRSASFGLFESMLREPSMATWFVEKMKRLQPILVKDYSEFVEDFCEAAVHVAEAIQGGECADAASLTVRLTGEESEYIICLFRYIVSNYLRTNPDDFLPFVMAMDYMTVDEYCRAEVDAVAQESDQVHVVGFAKAMGVRLMVQYIDLSPGENPTVHEFAPDTEDVACSPDTVTGPASPRDVCIHLIYRPGHYDLLYPSSS